MKTIIPLLCILVACLRVQPSQAQTKPVAAKPAPAKTATPAAKPTVTKAAPAEPVVAEATKPAEAPALITEKMEVAKPVSDALKINLDINPITKRVSVRTDSSGPTRIEVNDTDGRPVLTRDLVVGNKTALLDVSRLPTGQYIVQCSSGTRKGTKLLKLE
jgi:glucose/arabinose dehydrogenase